MTTTTHELCEEVERLDRDATDGPWSHFDGCCGNGLGHHHVHAPPPSRRRLVGQMPGLRGEDALLIARFRTLTPELARRLLAAEAALVTAEARLFVALETPVKGHDSPLMLRHRVEQVLAMVRDALAALKVGAEKA